MKYLFGFILFFTTIAAFGQEKGFVRGHIEDGEFGGPLIGAAVMIAELPGVGSTTDFDGNYSIPIEPGTYTIEVTFLSYATQRFENVEVKAGEVTFINSTMKSSAEALAAVEVVASVRRNSEVGVLMDMKKATNVTEGVSAQTFKKTGDSDLGDAMKRVTGVTVQGGKYLYVRGLGDRYTKTTVNGMAIPGLDPDANSVQIDIFPTSILENVAVYKTFSPDLEGDFTGGLVDVVTKSFPDEKNSNISLGLSFVPGMHFNSDFISYNGGKLDWAGYDDGTRKMHFNPNDKIKDESLVDPSLEELTAGFNRELAAKKSTALPNGSFSFAHGNQINRESGATVGYNAVFNYSNKHVFYTDFQSNDYLKNVNTSEYDLFRNVERTGIVGKNDVMWSGLLSGSYKKKNSTITATLLNTQNAVSSAAQRVNQDFNQNQSTLQETVLTYSQRTLSTFILNGKHRVGANTIIEWGNAASYSRVYDPDFRETRISTTDGDTTMSTGNGAGIDRFWRNLNEYNDNAKLDVTYEISKSAKIKGGVLGSYKTRTFDVYSYKHRRNNLSDVSIDPDWYLLDENLWSASAEDPNYRNGTYTIGNIQKANSYEARQTSFSAYALGEHNLFTEKLRAVYGVRVEKVDMYYTGQNNFGTIRYYDEKTLDNLNILPSANLVFAASDKVNLRLAANRTVARPSFKEKSIAQIYDPITKRTFIGNLDLEQTNINNFDFRYEYFLSAKELISVAAFYKQFDGHIELVAFPTAPDNLKPRNSGNAEVYGVEFEVRKAVSLKEEKKHLSRLFFVANLSLVNSAVDLNSVIVDEKGTTEYDLRQDYIRDDESLGNTRAMAGQSPYAINAAFTYEIPKSKTSISLAYNVQGEQLTIIGSGRVPDIYTMPFHSLNFNAYRSFGGKLQHKVTAGLGNIMNDDRLLVYRAYKGEDQIFTTYNPGVSINLKYGYSF